MIDRARPYRLSTASLSVIASHTLGTGAGAGAVSTKAQFEADIKSGALKLESSAISDLKVQPHGDVAVVTYRTADKGTYKGRDISGEYRWIDVFVRRGGQWWLVAGQGTRIQPTPQQ